MLPLRHSLSARLLVLTIFFVMVGEVLIFVPSVGRFRLTYLENHIAAGHLAILAVEATPNNVIEQPLANELLHHVGAVGIVLKRANRKALMIDGDMPPRIDAVVDLRETGIVDSVLGAVVTLSMAEDRVLRVIGISPKDPGAVIEVLLHEEPMRIEMWEFGRRILEISIVLSLITAGLVYFSLQWLLVRPMRRITAAMMAFREDPEDASRIIAPSQRGDEIGLAERELAVMQETVRQALRQKTRLAALGTAVAKINHDLRGILSTARLVSDSLAESAAPEVRRVAPTLLAAIDRAVGLCSRTLDFTREGAPPLRRERFRFGDLVEELLRIQEPSLPEGAELRNSVIDTIEIHADREQLYRVLFNLTRNAFEAGAHRVTITARKEGEEMIAEIADDGPGLPPKARENLFKPFAGSARFGGTGLGLAIARETMRAHGGDIALVESTATGTIFRLCLPLEPVAPARSAARQPAAKPLPSKLTAES
jgi:signal transduction histidine kinase